MREQKGGRVCVECDKFNKSPCVLGTDMIIRCVGYCREQGKNVYPESRTCELFTLKANSKGREK